MKLQLKVFSGSWWATEKRKETQKRRGYCFILQEQQVCCHSLFNLLQSFKKRALWICLTGILCNMDPAVLVHSVPAGRVSDT